MRFLILNTDYREFLTWLYAQHPGLAERSYKEQLNVRSESLFGVADFYSRNLQILGHVAIDIHANNGWLQRAWAREHGKDVGQSAHPRRYLSSVWQAARRVQAGWPLRYCKPLIQPFRRVLSRPPPWFYQVLAAQIRDFRPDVVLNQDMVGISRGFLREMKPYIRLLVGQHAAIPLPDAQDWNCYDVVISSFPPTIAWFRQRGIPAELSRLGFEPSVLNALRERTTRFDVVFVGSFSNVHRSRIAWLEALCARCPRISVWAPSVDHLPVQSPIRACYVGQVWGREMYQILADSKIVLNQHGDIPAYANNCRLYEATGVGSLLLTDDKDNLREMFEPGRELLAYRNPEECVELIRYYLKHDEEREAIARAGQERTLREHTYNHRMQELTDIIHTYLSGRTGSVHLVDTVAT